MRSPWASAAVLEDLSVIVGRWLRDHGQRELENPADLPPPGGELEDELGLHDEAPEEPREKKRRKREVSPPPELPRAEPAGEQEDDLEHKRAQEAGRKAMGEALSSCLVGQGAR